MCNFSRKFKYVFLDSSRVGDGESSCPRAAIVVEPRRFVSFDPFSDTLRTQHLTGPPFCSCGSGASFDDSGSRLYHWIKKIASANAVELVPQSLFLL